MTTDPSDELGRQRDARRAVVQLVGALAYGQLRAWSAAAAAVHLAPDVRTSEDLALRTGHEYALWRTWREHLDSLTDRPEAVMEQQREAFDDFFATVAEGDWEQACTVLAFAWPIAHDFAAMLAPSLPGATGRLAAELGAGGAQVSSFALDQLRDAMVDDDDVDRIRELAAAVVGNALGNYQQVVNDSTALDVLLSGTGPGDARRLAIDVWANHHRRLAALGIDDPE